MVNSRNRRMRAERTNSGCRSIRDSCERTWFPSILAFPSTSMVHDDISVKVVSRIFLTMYQIKLKIVSSTMWTPEIEHRGGATAHRIVDALAAAINEGDLAAGAQLPPHREL